MTGQHLGITIGQLAKQTSTSVQTLRYYETLGLISHPSRSEGNHRVYTAAHAERLSFIRHARELGFPLNEIRELLRLSDDPAQSCAMADAIARQQLVEVESRISRLTALKGELERMIDQCRAGTIGQCHVIAVLADHTHSSCVSANHAPDDVLKPTRKRTVRRARG